MNDDPIESCPDPACFSFFTRADATSSPVFVTRTERSSCAIRHGNAKLHIFRHIPPVHMDSPLSGTGNILHPAFRPFGKAQYKTRYITHPCWEQSTPMRKSFSLPHDFTEQERLRQPTYQHPVTDVGAKAPLERLFPMGPMTRPMNPVLFG